MYNIYTELKEKEPWVITTGGTDMYSYFLTGYAHCALEMKYMEKPSC